MTINQDRTYTSASKDETFEATLKAFMKLKSFRKRRCILLLFLWPYFRNVLKALISYSAPKHRTCKNTVTTVYETLLNEITLHSLTFFTDFFFLELL